MRLAKFLAVAGAASRRKAEAMVRAGRVRVNGIKVTAPQTLIKEGDLVTVDGRLLRAAEEKYYLLLDKPPGYISTVVDTHGRPTVLDLVPDLPARLFPVGRLDADTTGLLLLTNDGELAYRLTHPRFRVEKVYRAWVKGVPGEEALRHISRGVELSGKVTAPAKVRLIKRVGLKRSLLELTLAEGRKRQVKEMCAAVGHPVLSLRRIRFAFLTGRGLQPGSYRLLRPAEVKRLYRLVELPYPQGGS